MNKNLARTLAPEPLHDEDRVYVVGYWLEGHVDKQQFAIACNKKFNLASWSVPVTATEVSHCYAKRVDYPDGGYWLEFGKGDGAIALTFVEG